MKRLGIPVLAVLVLLVLAGAVRAGTVTYEAFLDGPSESPPNASPGTGSARVTLDDVAHTLRLEFDFADLIGTTTAAHIHGPTADPLTGLAGIITPGTLLGFPVGVTSGTYDLTFDLTLTTSYAGSFVTANGGTAAGAEAALAAALAAEKTYLNIHTTVFPGGEIRGFLRPAAVPLPAALPAGLGLFALFLTGLRRSRRRRGGPSRAPVPPPPRPLAGGPAAVPSARSAGG